MLALRDLDKKVCDASLYVALQQYMLSKAQYVFSRNLVLRSAKI